ncbi:MAG: hypothetical protein AAF899_12940 [Pseudomonadota bacterium]
MKGKPWTDDEIAEMMAPLAGMKVTEQAAALGRGGLSAATYRGSTTLTPPVATPRLPPSPLRVPVLGLTGPAGSGKSTVAAAVLEGLPWPGVRLHVAAPVHAMLATLLKAAGMGVREIAERVHGAQKNAPCDALQGRSPRQAMQWLGTEWGRELVGDRLWLDLWRRRAAREIRGGRLVINESVRFDNEAAVVRSLGGVVVRLTGRRAEGVPAHDSEVGVTADLDIDNGAGLPERAARQILELVK